MLSTTTIYYTPIPQRRSIETVACRFLPKKMYIPRPAAGGRRAGTHGLAGRAVVHHYGRPDIWPYCTRQSICHVLDTAHTAKRPDNQWSANSVFAVSLSTGTRQILRRVLALTHGKKKGRVTAHDVDVRFAVCPNSVAHGKKAFLVFFYSGHVYGTPNQIKISCSSYISQILHRIVHTS